MNHVHVEQLDNSKIQSSILMKIFSIEDEATIDQLLSTYRVEGHDLILKKIYLILFGKALGLLSDKAIDIVSDKEFMTSLLNLNPKADRLFNILKYFMDDRAIKSDDESLRLNLVSYEDLKQRYLTLLNNSSHSTSSQDAELLTKLEEAEGQIGFLDKYNNENLQVIDALRKERALNEHEIEQLQTDLSSMREDLKGLYKREKELTEEIYHLKAHNDTLHVKASDISEEGLIRENEELKKKLYYSETMLAAQKDGYDASVEELKNADEIADRLTIENQRLRDENERLKHHVFSPLTTPSKSHPQSIASHMIVGGPSPTQTISPASRNGHLNYPVSPSPFKLPPPHLPVVMEGMEGSIMSEELQKAKFDHRLYVDNPNVEHITIGDSDNWEIYDVVGLPFYNLDTGYTSIVVEKDPDMDYCIFIQDEDRPYLFSIGGERHNILSDGDYLFSYNIGKIPRDEDGNHINSLWANVNTEMTVKANELVRGRGFNKGFNSPRISEELKKAKFDHRLYADDSNLRRPYETEPWVSPDSWVVTRDLNNILSYDLDTGVTLTEVSGNHDRSFHVVNVKDPIQFLPLAEGVADGDYVFSFNTSGVLRDVDGDFKDEFYIPLHDSMEKKAKQLVINEI